MENLITHEVEDQYLEHELHKNMVKGIMGRKCSTCYAEHLEIRKRFAERSEGEPRDDDFRARVEDDIRVNRNNPYA